MFNIVYYKVHHNINYGFIDNIKNLISKYVKIRTQCKFKVAKMACDIEDIIPYIKSHILEEIKYYD